MSPAPFWNWSSRSAIPFASSLIRIMGTARPLIFLTIEVSLFREVQTSGFIIDFPVAGESPQDEIESFRIIGEFVFESVVIPGARGRTSWNGEEASDKWERGSAMRCAEPSGVN